MYSCFKPARSEKGSLRDEIPQAGFRAAALTYLPYYSTFSRKTFALSDLGVEKKISGGASSMSTP